MAEKITYRDYLTQRVANAISALADGLSTGMQMQDESYAVDYIERQMLVARELLRKRDPDPERVHARPVEEDDDGY